MNAIIVETPIGDRRQPQPDKALSQRATQSSAADRNYYRQRAVQEAEAARMASCNEARIAHEELASAYRQLCRSNGASFLFDA